MLNHEERKHSRVTATGRTAFAALFCVLTLSLWEVPVAYGKPIPWGHWLPEHLKLLCQNEGGIFGPPATPGGVFYCLLPDGTLYTCNGDGQCTKDSGRAASAGLTLPDRMDRAEAKYDLIVSQLDRLTAQLSALEEFLVHGVAPIADLTPLPSPGTSNPAGFCRRDDQGNLHVHVVNQGTADATDSVTRVVFSCGNPQQCNGPTQVDSATPKLQKLGDTADRVFNIPAGCFSPSTNNCSFEIRADAGNAVTESDENNNIKAGVCGVQFQ